MATAMVTAMATETNSRLIGRRALKNTFLIFLGIRNRRDTYIRSEVPALKSASGKRFFAFKCVQAGDATLQLDRCYASDPEHILY